MKTEAGFAYRHNDDGTVDAICLRCFRTIATAESIASLEDSCDHHRCSETDLVSESGSLKLMTNPKRAPSNQNSSKAAQIVALLTWD